MTSLDYTVRLFILVTFTMTTLACITRALRSDESRAVVGNLAFGSATAVGVYAQIPARTMPLETLDWLRVAVCFVCIGYLAVLARKGL